ncbi:Type I secretion system ATP-binding protein PrsD [Shimia sp. SK013]|uniref:ATP-binding cassette domain-containing protein n=1 Tax=Shimia sp. SK013 TaxID=1389006 RepID=UPI0006B4C105|nr:ATP-binding cassette domain-containing protein [Shimia sp. SK013]KPA23200.1 Type I secretion system ATP-binding protein PrsD [Shimia sp. SK013]
MSSPNIGQLKRLSVPLVALSLITNLAILVNPIFMMQVLDRVVPTGNMHTLAMLLGVALGALALQAMVEYLRDVSFHRAAHWLERASLPAVLASPRDVRDALMTDRNQLSGALSGGAAVTALMLPWIPLFLLVLWVIHPWFLAMAICLTGLSATVRLAGDSLLGAGRSQHAKLSQQEATTLRDAEVVIAGSGMPGMFRNLLDRFSATMSRRLSVADQMTRPTVATASLSSFLRAATQLLGLSLGAALVVTGDLSAGGMIAASLILARSVANIEQILIQWPQMTAARSAFHRLGAIPDVAEPSATEIPKLSGALSCKSLIFPRGGGAPPRLEKISFALPPGSCLAVVGSSGGGKTTLLEALSGVAPALLVQCCWKKPT